MELLLKCFSIGVATGLAIGAGGAYILCLIYELSETSDSVIGTGVLGAGAGGMIGAAIGVFSLLIRQLRDH